MKARLKAQMKARQDMIDKMDPTEYKAYRHRVKALKDAKAATKARREALRAAWRANADVGFEKLDPALYAPDYAALAQAAITGRKYTDVTAADIKDYISGHPDKSMLSAYAEKLKDWDKHVAAPRPTFGDVAYVGPSLTGRALWLGVTRRKLQLMQKLQQQQQQRQQQQGMNVEEK